MSEIHFRLHFWPFQVKTQHNFFSQNGRWRPFWMLEIHFCLNFSPFLAIFICMSLPKVYDEDFYEKW